jgi:hypothetical protein
MVDTIPASGQRNTGDPPPYIDYSQGAYSTPGVQQLLQTMDPRWTNQWEDPNLQGGFVDPAGSSWTLGRTKGLIDKAINDFTQQVQAVTGQAPTSDQISSFFQNQLVPMASQAQPGGYNPILPQDITSSIQQYVPTAFAQPIQQYQQQQQTDALKQNIGTGTDLINQAMTGFTQNLTDPNSQMYKNFAGGMNGLGFTPSSGAFQAGLGGAVGNEANQLQQQLMSTLGFPSLSGIQGLSGQANQSLQGAAPIAQANLTSQQNQLSDFGRMQAIAQMLQQQMQPSAAQKDIGMASGAANAAGNLMKGAGSMIGATWICTAMVESGFMTRGEVKALHSHLYRAFWKRPWKFIGYILFGKLLVYLANNVRTHWGSWKPAFYDEVMKESDSAKAVDIYETAFWDLFRVIRQRKESSWRSITR